MIKKLDFVDTYSLYKEITKENIQGGILLVKGIPNCVSDVVLLKIIHLLGSEVNYPSSQYGSKLIHELKSNSPSLVSDGIDWHTEDSFRLIPPKYVALYCVKGCVSVNTLFAKITLKDDFKNLDVKVKADPYLYKKHQSIYLPLSFNTNKNSKALGYRYDGALIPDSKIHFVLDSLLTLNLEENDLLVFDNHLLAHSKHGVDERKQRQLKRVIIL